MEQVRAFVEGSGPVDYQPEDRRCAYEFVRRPPVRVASPLLGRAARGCVRAYIGKACGVSLAQTSRLVRQQAETGVVADRRARNSGRAFETRSTPAPVLAGGGRHDTLMLPAAGRGRRGAGNGRWRPASAPSHRQAVNPVRPGREQR